MNNTSYKDPAGFIFNLDGTFYRQINNCAKADYDLLINSGLYEKLTSNKMLITHEEVVFEEKQDCNAYKYIKPKQIKYISYPYEWAFSALKDAALLTLKIQKTALKYGMSLKDASAYNIQFFEGRPVFIDTLSFESYTKNTPWKAYGQFCRHFLAPLALMSYTDISLNRLLTSYIDGIPLPLAKKLLPIHSNLNFGILTHIILHSLSQKVFEDKSQCFSKKAKMSLFELESLLESLENTVNGLKFPNINTEWGLYYENTNYCNSSFNEKKSIISNFIDKVSPSSICDLGANRGDFSRIASEKNIQTVSFDIDPLAVENSYMHLKKYKEKNILPLLQDFNNPSPAIGFMNEERFSFSNRYKCDMVMALALIHHLAISNNLPFKNIAEFFSLLGEYLIIEFVPKSDSKVQILLSSREDIFDKYDITNFESDFGNFFEIMQKVHIKDSERIMYLMRRK